MKRKRLRLIVPVALFVMLLCGVARGSFLNEATVNTGMYGYKAASVALGNLNVTYVDTDQPIQAAGTLSRIHMRFYGNGATSTVNKFAIVRETSSQNYNIVGVIDVTAHMNAAWTAAGESAQRFEYDTAVTYGAEGPLDLSGITVVKGDMLACYMETNIYPGLNDSHTGFSVDYEAGDLLTSGAITVDDTTTENASFVVDVFVTTTKAFILDDSTGWGDGEELLLPSFTGEIYTIILEDVVVPDAEDFKLNIIARTMTNMIDRDDNNFYLDMTQAAGSDVMAIRKEDDAVLFSQTVTFEGGAGDDRYTIFITIDPNAHTSAAMKVMYVNYQNGQGAKTSDPNSTDISHVSLGNGGSWFARSWQYPPRIIQMSQGTGSGASVARIVVTRKFIVGVGNSFVAKHISDAAGMELSGIAEKLNDNGRFTEDRYVVIGGIPGNRMLTEAGLASITQRFNSPLTKMGDLSGAVYVFCNGPGINDIAGGSKPTTNDEAIALGKALAWQIMAMASRAIENQSEVVLNEICYLEPGHAQQNAYTDLAVKTYNQTLRRVSALLQVPLAKTAKTVLANAGTYYKDDHIHLETVGYEYMADTIVTAYEGGVTDVSPELNIGPVANPWR